MRIGILFSAIIVGTPVAGFGQLVPSPATMTAPLLAGEVLLQTSAQGMAILPTERINFVFLVRCSAATEKLAKSIHARELERLKADLLAVHLPPSALSVPQGSTSVRSVEFWRPNQPEKEPAFASSAHEVTVEDMTLWPAVRDVLIRHKIDLTGAILGGGAKLRDERVGRQKAIADGVAKARSEAEAYAAPLGMRVARVLRVSDSLSLTELAGAVQDRGRSPDGSLETVAVVAPVSIDFALKPL